MQRPLIPGHNNNRHLTYDEVENNIGGLPVTEPRLQQLFHQLDVNKNGYLEFGEMKKFYKTFDNFGVEYSDREIQENIRKYAKNSNGTISFDEFCCIVLSLAQR
eukprot:Tbor_TRINITY_DN5729_c1_g1::TRINITY_DN5729_c1_g1_i8::g.19707::m.19707